MTLKHALSRAARQATPRPIWNMYLRARGLPQVPQTRHFDGISTAADPTPLLSGRFAALHEQYIKLNPFYRGSSYLYQHYNDCFFANLCRDVPGDFLIAGVAFGATAKLVYEYVQFPRLGKTLHLVDPFDRRANGRVADTYNADPERVRQLFPSAVVIHQQAIPIDPPGPLAFVLCDTGEPEADLAALPPYEALSPGGVWLCHCYGRNTAMFQPAFNKLNVLPFWLPSGQCVIIKR
jgi:hypothetical protein